jgi:hypothetical protein
MFALAFLSGYVWSSDLGTCKLGNRTPGLDNEASSLLRRLRTWKRLGISLYRSQFRSSRKILLIRILVIVALFRNQRSNYINS